MSIYENKLDDTTISQDTTDTASQGDTLAELKFEDAMHELENLVANMERGDLSLDESLKAFERGVALTRRCQSALQAAELKVQALTEDGEIIDFESGEIDDR